MENQETPRLAQHRQAMKRFLELREADAQGALAFARSAVEDSEQWRRNDQRRGDALELLALAYSHFEQFDQAIEPTTELVRIRRAAKPLDYELLALALMTQATALFALGRSEEADEALREQLESWRDAFDARDLRLAQKLEGQAEYVQKGFGRTEWAIELLKEAVEIRNEHPEASPGRFAATLQELAIHQLRQHEYGEADANLARARSLLEQEIALDPSREENRAGLAQILVLRSGIAGALAQKDRAIAEAEAARNIKFQDRTLQAENEILVAAALSSVLELTGDISAAIAEQHKVLEVYLNNDDLLANGSLDKHGISDTLSCLGSLYLEQGDLQLARQAIITARRQLGNTSELLFKMAELERKRGREIAALRNYRKALRRRKESASEVSLLFGTTRLLESNPEDPLFGGNAGEHVSTGKAVVLVPGAQFSTKAWLESASPLIPVGAATNPESLHIRSKCTLTPKQFSAQARKLVARARLYPNSALVFVHGYNVTFDNALRRGAQLARDLNYDSALFVFSWPSKGKRLRYGTDRDSADKAAESLASFLGMIEAASGAEKIHLIAHSMGNRVLLPALVKVVNDVKSKVRSKIGEVILAAPAVPKEEFVAWIDELGRHGLDRFTLYASAVDKAMRVGYWREWLTVLAGYVAGGQPLLNPNVHSIDVSEAGNIGLTQLNHDVFTSNPVMTEDMRQLFQNGLRPPEKRIPTLEVRSVESSPTSFWYYSNHPPKRK